MRGAFRERWYVYVAWLGSGVSGIRPEEVRRTVGPVWALLPLARQVAQALGPWLAALLAARQGRGLAALSAEDEQEVAEVFAEETRLRPFERQEAWRSDAWLGWLLVGELRRLAQLAEAPEATMRRPGWLAWEVRYWALAVSLVRIGQVYGALEQREGVEAAQGIFKGALARVWRQAVQTERAA